MRKNEIEIVCLSRGRAENMKQLFKLLPGALVTVNESEVDEYAKHVDRSCILPHPEMHGAPMARNWILQNVDAEVIVMVDDDLKAVRSNVGSMRRITAPDEILQIILNAAQNCLDTGVNVFGFARTENVVFMQCETEPVKPMHPIYGLVGVIGPAKRILYDETLRSRADLDWTLQVLLKERVVYADTRFYFDFGASFTGSGGHSGTVNANDFRDSILTIKERWGRHVKVSGPSLFDHRATSSASLRVKRKAKNAER